MGIYTCPYCLQKYRISDEKVKEMIEKTEEGKILATTCKNCGIAFQLTEKGTRPIKSEMAKLSLGSSCSHLSIRY